MAYPTLANLKTLLKITDATADFGLQMALDTAVDWVEDFTGRTFIGTAATVTDEQYDLNTLTQTADGSVIALRQMDIVSVTAVKLNGQVIDATGYKWNEAGRLVIFGRIFNVSNRAFYDYQYVTVSYTYGLATPKAISGAVSMLAMAFWNDQLAMKTTSADTGIGSDANANTAKTERIGDYMITTGSGVSSGSENSSALTGGKGAGSTGTINSISRMLDSYRKRRI